MEFRTEIIHLIYFRIPLTVQLQGQSTAADHVHRQALERLINVQFRTGFLLQNVHHFIDTLAHQRQHLQSQTFKLFPNEMQILKYVRQSVTSYEFQFQRAERRCQNVSDFFPSLIAQ